MKNLLIILFLFIGYVGFAQPYTYHLRYDTVKFTTANNSEFVLRSSTRDSTNGVLINIGGGITQFKRIRAISATQFTVGTDTITITGSGGGGGTYTEGYGIDITSNVVSADTAILGPLWRSQISVPNLIAQNSGTGQQSWWASGDTLYKKRFGNTYGLNVTTAADSSMLLTIDSTKYVPKETTSQITGTKTFTQDVTIQQNGDPPYLQLNRMGTTSNQNLGGVLYMDNSVVKMYSFLVNFADTGWALRQGNGVSTKSWNTEDKFGHMSLGFSTFTRGYAVDVSHASGNYGADSSLIMGMLRYRWINAGSNVVDSFKVDRGANLVSSGNITAEIDSTGTGTAINMVYQGVDKKLYRAAVPAGGGSSYTFSSGVFESAGAVKVDTFLVGTRAQTTKRIDSLALLITGGGGVPSVDVQIFTATGANTWTKPAGAKAVFITLVAGGGGGGSGMRGAAGGTRCGGGGAGGGGYASIMLPAAALGATETVTVGAGGAGGAARTSDDQTGANGVAGGVSSFGNYIRAINGTAGTGGSATSGVGGSGGAGWPVVGTSVSGGAGGAANVAGGAGAVGSNSNMGGSGGAAGGGLSVGNTITAGGVGGAVGGAAQSGFVSGVVAGGTAGSSGGGTGGNGGANTANIAVGGGGGGGGGSVITGNAGAGGNSGIYGAGGGGGGASTNGGNSGAGGSGANGIVIIITYF